MRIWTPGTKLGYGRFGVVYEAHCGQDPLESTALHAIKFLQRDLVSSKEIVKRFEREIDLLRGLNHPNIMPVVDAGWTAQRVPWFVMPKASHGSLKAAIQRGDSQDRDWVIDVFKGILAGVACAHEARIVHRDLKPGNILMLGAVPLVSDFGVAKQLDLDDTSLTHSTQQLGTLRYMAPEQLDNAKRVRPAADVYSLGKLLIYMLSEVAPEPFKVDIAVLPAELRFFVDKCCREAPADRYEDATAALCAFEQVLNAEPIEVHPVQTLDQLVVDYAFATDDDEERRILRMIDVHLRSHPNNRELFIDSWVDLPIKLVARLASDFPDGFRGHLRIYDAYASVGLPFCYCDTVADRYHQLFRLTDDLEVHRIVLRRLLDLGYSHNRWHVREVLSELLAEITSPEDVAIAEEAIQGNSRAAAWNADHALRRQVGQQIAVALRQAQDAHAA